MGMSRSRSRSRSRNRSRAGARQHEEVGTERKLAGDVAGGSERLDAGVVVDKASTGQSSVSQASYLKLTVPG